MLKKLKVLLLQFTAALSLIAAGEPSPEVTVIMPVWNRAAIMAESIESVRAQTFKNWELILIDDGSVDDSLAVARRYAALDPRIRVIALEQNQGIARARNAGIDVARGEYIAFLDSDDLWKPQKLERQLQFMRSKNIKFSFTRFEKGVVGEDIFIEQFNFPASVSYEEALVKNYISPITVMLHKSLLEDVRFENIIPEDWSLWLRLLESKVDRAYLLDENLLTIRVSENSVSRNKLLQARRVWNMYRTSRQFGVLRTAYYFFFWSEDTLQKYSVRFLKRLQCELRLKTAKNWHP